MEDSLNVTKAFQEHHRQVRLNLAKAFGYSEDNLEKSHEPTYTEEQLDIIKGLQSENPFERQAAQDALEKSEMNEIEKSDIMSAISCDENFKIKKSGKEIKEQIKNVILPNKQAELAAKKSEADELLSECGDAPTSDCCCYDYGMEIDCGYKSYRWDETYIKEDNDSVCESLSYEHQQDKPKCNYPKTKDEADARCKYNRTVDIICRIMVDIKACGILVKNMKDNDEIKMTPRQVAVFKMD